MKTPSGKKDKNTVNNKTNNKAGYDNDCLSLQKKTNRISMLLHKYPKEPFLRNSFLQKKRDYKKLVKRKNNEYKESILKQLEMMQSINLK